MCRGVYCFLFDVLVIPSTKSTFSGVSSVNRGSNIGVTTFVKKICAFSCDENFTNNPHEDHTTKKLEPKTAPGRLIMLKGPD